jgi:hypothetical protein
MEHNYKIGEVYLHQKFGKIIIDNIDNKIKSNQILEVTTESGKQTKLMSNYVKLQKLDGDFSSLNELYKEKDYNKSEIVNRIIEREKIKEEEKKEKESKPKKTKSASAKKTIAEIVKDAEVELKAMKSHTELRNWAIGKNMDNRAAFPKFKLALNEIGLDYDDIKKGIFSGQKEELENKINYSVTLYVDAKSSAYKFGITDKDGEVLWYGRFFDDDDAGEQSRAELAAAKKAVWLASKIKEACNQQAIKLLLYVDAQWLTYQDHGGQKGYALTLLARKHNIDLDVRWIRGVDNPADKWTTASGYKKWQDNKLTSLVEPIEGKEVEPIIEIALHDIKQSEKPTKVKIKAIKILGGASDYDKSYGIRFSVYEVISEQSVSRTIFFPKSVVLEKGQHYLIVPKWIYDKKMDEVLDGLANNTFKRNTFQVELDTEEVWLEKDIEPKEADVKIIIVDEPKEQEEVFKEKTKTIPNVLNTDIEDDKIKDFNKNRSNRSIKEDEKYQALPKGKRVSESGRVYYENRPNHSDISSTKKLKDGGYIKGGQLSTALSILQQTNVPALFQQAKDNNPDELIKYISEQGQGLQDDNKEVLYKATCKMFGKELTDASIEAYPIKESGGLLSDCGCHEKGGEIEEVVLCQNCGHEWETKGKNPNYKYICFKCTYNNEKHYK